MLVIGYEVALQARDGGLPAVYGYLLWSVPAVCFLSGFWCAYLLSKAFGSDDARRLIVFLIGFMLLEFAYAFCIFQGCTAVLDPYRK